MQIFSASPRMWRAKGPDAGDIARMRTAREKLDVNPVAIHANYLVNLATLEHDVREKSVASFRGELDRAAAIGAEYLIVHPGNYKGQTAEQGVAAFVLGLAEAADPAKHRNVTVLLENTVGAGHQIGSRLEELRMIRDLAARETELSIAYCLDTCHLLAAGFDIATEAGLTATAAHVERVLGFDLVKVIHTNDSKGALGSHLDRHENIGAGKIGAEGFRRILAHPSFRDKPFILETPEDEGKGTGHREDVALLWHLARTGA